MPNKDAIPKRDPGDVFPRTSGLADSAHFANEDWHGWINAMPPGPASVHIIGDVTVANAGVLAILTLASPPGINPASLLLDLHLIQQPGIWPMVVTTTQARFDRVIRPGIAQPTAAEIRHNGRIIATIPELSVVS